jgi:arylsulfatase
MPTLLSAADISVPITVDGKNLLPVLLEPAIDWRDYVHGEHCLAYSEEQEMQFVTDGRRKLIWFPRIEKEQFFDLEQDPGECTNLIDDPIRQKEILRWRGFLIDELRDRDCGWVRDGELFCPTDEPLVSPYRDSRWVGEV